MRLSLDLLRVVFGTSRTLGIACLLVTAAGGLLPLFVILSIGAFIEALVATSAENVFLSSVVSGRFTIVIVFLSLQYCIGPVTNVVGESIRRRVDSVTSQHVARAALQEATIQRLQEVTYRNDVSVALGLDVGSRTLGGAAAAIPQMGSQSLKAIGTAAVLSTYKWWLGVALFLVWYAIGSWTRRQYVATTKNLNRSTEEFRQGHYFFNAVATRDAAKEIRLFALQPWFESRFKGEFAAIFKDIWSNRRALSLGTASMAAAVLAITGGATFLLGAETRAGTITVGELTIYVQALVLMAATATSSPARFEIEYARVAIPALDRVKSSPPTLGPEGPSTSSGLDLAAPRASIELRSVEFSYNDQDSKRILCDVNLTIPAGRSTAVVGVNGAGKSTLAKLVGGLLRPTKGDVLVDGVALGAISLQEWQRRVAIVFQDFVKYPLSVRDNIRFGNVERAPFTPENAARLGGASDLINGMPWGWDSVLCKGLPKSLEPSGGEWQRIALARAFQAVECGAKVLILDEPTSSLDVRGEVAFYETFLDATKGITTILISHRFPSVRRADNICVLDDGLISESGTHDELMAEDGSYARMFKLQAAAFTG